MASETGQPNWTPEQRSAIETVNANLLVSAAAGSGKTAVLAQRCVHLVCDAASPCDVDELLVVTFTEAAAAEMKSRIGSSLRKRAAGGSSPRLDRQLALIDHAQVSTLHGFCAKLLRQNFHLAGIDPAFRILDGEEAGLLRQEIARNLVRETYENENSAGFTNFLDAYCEGDEQRLTKLLASTHEMLCSLVDPNDWVRKAPKRLAEAIDGRLEDSELGRELTKWIVSGLDALLRQCQDGVRQLTRLGSFPTYRQYISQQLQPIILHWKDVFASAGLDALAEESRIEYPRLDPVPNSIPNKELAKAIVDGIRDQMKEGAWRDAMAFTTAQWRDGLVRTLPHAKAFLEVVGQFSRRYRAAKDASRALDFADLERMSLKVLTGKLKGEPSPTALAYHRRFAHVLVDEYQDINELQDELLSLLSHERAARRPGTPANAFYVGDVKQSIYRFRLAEPARFLAREKGYRDHTRDGTVIDLQANFRSRAPLLEAINAVFERLMTFEAADIAYDKSHRLVAKAAFPPWRSKSFSGAPIELHVIPSQVDVARQSGDDEEQPDRTEREAIFVATRIRELMGTEPGGEPRLISDKDAQGKTSLRPIRFADIVILLRTMRFKSEQFVRILAEFDVPAHADSVTGYFESMEVRDMLALLQILDNARQDIPLATFLRSPLAALPAPEDAMARVRLAYPAGAKGDVPFHEAVIRYAQEQTDALAAELKRALTKIERWRELAQRRPLEELLTDVYQQDGFLAYCEGLSDGKQRVANLVLLRDKARQFSSFERPGLARFLVFLESIQEEADIGLPSTVTAAQDVVRIMSVHRSKGLEFPIVFLPDLGKRINLADAQGQILIDRSLGLGIRVVDEELFVRYPSLASTLVGRHVRKQAMAEELRVLYVAMTRAKEHLILVGSASEKMQGETVQRWTGHQGPLPPEEILGVNTMLQWVLAVAAATGSQAAPAFALTQHKEEDVATWRSHRGRHVEQSADQLTISRMQPLAGESTLTPEARQIVSRLETPYPFERFAAVNAAQSVTGHAESSDTPAPSPRDAGHAPRERALERPRFLLAETQISATERGTAAHLILQHLDFKRPCTASDIEEQIRAMIDRRAIFPAEADQVSRDALLWFVNTDIGQRLRRESGQIYREIPVYFTLDAPDIGTCDQPMIRGRLDLLLPAEDGHIIVDYKTDAVNDFTIQARADEYRPQMKLYRQAIERITGKRVTEIHLVFLAAKKVVLLDVPAEELRVEDVKRET